MPFLDPAKRRAHARQWVAKRRAAWFAANGPCKRCASTDRLELHHRDQADKESHRIWSWAQDRLAVELAKCDVLCHDCHLTETRAQLRSTAEHGTRARYAHGCKCDPCRAANAEYARNRRVATVAA